MSLFYSLNVESKNSSSVSVVIPVFNEEKTIELVLKEIPKDYEIIVVDDHSLDSTARIAEKYAVVLRNPKNLGYEKSLIKGINYTSGKTIVSMDGDLEHKPKDISRLLKKLGEADFVVAERPFLPRRIEYIMAWLVRRKIPFIQDPANGFRAIKRKVIDSIKLERMCFGANLLLRAHKKGFCIKTVRIAVKRRHESRLRIKVILKEFLFLIKEMLKG